MSTSILSFNIIRSPKTKFSDAQVLLQEFTGQTFSRNEADAIWGKIINHKWNISEKLNRDVGFRTATIDFIENFYQPQKEIARTENSSEITVNISTFLRKVFRSYFESKGNIINF